MVVQAEEIINILGERTMHIGSGNKVYLNVSLSKLLLRWTIWIISNFFANLCCSRIYPSVVIITLQYVEYQVFFILFLHFVVNFFSVVLLFALFYSQKMKGTTIYFISCVHLLCSLNMNILNWVGLEKITCSSVLQCSILRLGFQGLGCLVHYSINLTPLK